MAVGAAMVRLQSTPALELPAHLLANLPGFSGAYPERSGQRGGRKLISDGLDSCLCRVGKGVSQNFAKGKADSIK
jgi:hypothetical protein